MLARANGSPGRYQLLAMLVLAAGLVLGALPLSLRWSALWAAPGGPPGGNHRLVSDFGRFPLQFEPNVGQTGASVRYLAHAPGAMLYFTPSGLVMSFGGSGIGDRGSGIGGR